VKVRKLEAAVPRSGAGPDTDIVQLLRYHDYTYHAGTRYWRHPNKDPEQVADAFEHGKIRGQSVRVTRDWGHPTESSYESGITLLWNRRL